MEQRRAPESVVVFAYERGFSPIFATAALSVVLLLTVLGWQLTRSQDAHNAPRAISNSASTSASAQDSFVHSTDLFYGTEAPTSSPNGLSLLGNAVLQQLEGAYQQMQQTGTYSTSSAQAAGQSLAPYLSANVQYPTFNESAIKTDSDTSYTRMLRYRSDLQTSLAPLLQNTEPEYEIFAYYIETKDVSYLTTLQSVANTYQAVASSTAQIVVPADAVSYQVSILNAMEEFSATLNQLAVHANDPFASAALLESYNQAESDMLSAFNNLATYYKSKTP